MNIALSGFWSKLCLFGVCVPSVPEVICFLDMEGFVQKEEEKRSERYRATDEIWLNDLCSFMDREVTRKDWFCVFNRLLESIVGCLHEQRRMAKDGDSTKLCAEF